MASIEGGRGQTNRIDQERETTPGLDVHVLVVDEFPIWRQALTAVLGGFPGLTVVGEADTADAAERLARRLRPGLVVIDPVMASGDAYEALSLMRAELPDARLLVFARTDDLDVATEAIRRGADGFLVKTVSQSALLNAVQRLLRGQSVVNPDLALRALRAGSAGTPHAAAPEPLTPRELEVLRLLGAGHTNPQIARSLFMAVGTVKVHVEHILGKLGAASRTDAAVRAAGLGLLRPEPDEAASATRPMPPGS
jgi:two-component system, NarL family, nitrate/nitrite response regulator NarL